MYGYWRPIFANAVPLFCCVGRTCYYPKAGTPMQVRRGPKPSNACKHGLSMMLPTNPATRDHAPRVGGQEGCRLTILQAALTSIGETKQRVSAPNTSSSSPAGSRGKFKCDDCGRLFSTKGNMMRHAQATHARGGAKIFPCGVCGRKFKRREDLVTHGRVHTGEKPYACSHKGCGRRFARISDQRSHERIHSSNSKRFECKHCGKRFTRPYDLKKHEMNIHRAGLTAVGKRKENGVGADILTGGSVGAGKARNGGSKRLRATEVEISGTIPGKNMRDRSAHSSQSPPMVAGAAANTLGATAVQQQFQEQSARASQPLPIMAGAAANGLIAAAVQQQQQQQQLQEKTGQSSQPLPIVASAAADESVATAQEQQPQEQAAHSPQPLPTKVTAAADGLVPMVEQQQQVAQEQHNQQWRQKYHVWQRKQQQQQQLNNQRQPHPEKRGSLADLSLPPVGQGQELLPLTLLPSQPLPPLPPPQGPVHAKAAAAAAAAPPNPKAAAAPHGHLRRKRVRCDAHKHFDPAAGREIVNPQGGATMTSVPRGSAAGGSTPQPGDGRRQEQNITEAFAEAKAHVHGAACGHVAVLHDNHVDFLVENGQLECFAGKEKTPEDWVSTAKEGSGEGGCGCHDAATKMKADAAGNGNNNTSSDSNSSNSNGNSNGNSSSSSSSNNNSYNNGNDNNNNSNKDNSEINSDSSKGNGNGNKRDCCKGSPSWKMVTRDDLIHWDGARTDQPRGNCPGDNHGPHCGHDVVHHNGHLDYVVNGRLIHPVQVDPAADDENDDGTGSGGAAAAPQMQFEDHGSIQALEEDFVAFWSSFSLLRETADEEVLSFCDICSSDDTGGVNLSPVT